MDGLLLFARFAFMPNHLGYCGADANAEIAAYLREGSSDHGLRRHLATFGGALPHLRLIADANDIADPFDARVVEAYWIGNDLLERVDCTLHARRLHDRLQERMGARLRPATVELLSGKPQAGARAHHAFHVFDLSFRTGLPGGDAALDLCRISWGTVTAVEREAYTVVYNPVVIRAGRLAFGPRQPMRVMRMDGTDPVAIGDLLAFHWRMACMGLSPSQAANLERYTRGMMALANQTF
jgi:hypothetical protein